MEEREKKRIVRSSKKRANAVSNKFDPTPAAGKPARHAGSKDVGTGEKLVGHCTRDTEAELFARLKEENPEFRRLAEKHREFDLKISEYDRISYLTSEQERKRKELQKLSLKTKDEMYAAMRQYRSQMQWHEKRLTLEDYRRGLSGLSREELEMLLRILSDHLLGVPAPPPSRRSLLELEGLGAEIWRGLDAQEYVNHERDSWTS